MNVKYTADFANYSGYGEASRNTIASLYMKGVNLTTERMDFSIEKVNSGWMGQLAEERRDKCLDYQIKILQVTPEHYSKIIEKGKYNIGILFWETDKIPKDWVKNMNEVDEFWVVSEQSKQIFANSGIKSKLTVIPQSMDYASIIGCKPYSLLDGYKFYSIFQWTERKNPRAMIQSFLKAFPDNEHVSFFIKTYRANFSQSESKIITDSIIKWRKEITDSLYPKIILSLDALSNEDIFRIHASCDCLVSSHRGEGWGMPQMQAMSFGNPIISTAYGGIHDYINKDCYYPIPYELIKVERMEWIPWYTPDQCWADVNEEQLIKTLKYVYKHQKEAQKIGTKGREETMKIFDIHLLGQIMKKRLEEIEKQL